MVLIINVTKSVPASKAIRTRLSTLARAGRA